MSTEKSEKGVILHGIGVSPGIRIGRVEAIEYEKLKVPWSELAGEQVELEAARYDQAVTRAIDQLERQKRRVNRHSSEEHYFILEAHQYMLKDDMLAAEPSKLIRDHHFNAEWALKITLERLNDNFSRMDGEMARKRITDLADVGRRVMENLMGVRRRALNDIRADSILVAHTITPGDATHFYSHPVRGFALEVGGKASHIAIVARSMEIPAVLGLENLLTVAKQGDWLVIDGSRGLVVVNPDAEQLDRYRKKEASYDDWNERLHVNRDLPAVTQDGVRIVLKGNIESVEETPTLAEHGAEGVGLFRTEFMYMDRTRPPTEDEHYAYYRRLVESCDCGPVTIRTMDIGSDKYPAYWPYVDEANPALGCRAIRGIARDRQFFVDQIRAIYRAGVHGDVKLLLPFISGVAEVDDVKVLLEDVLKNMREEGAEFNPDIPLGVMIELPSAAIVSDHLATRVDYFSIGTNDLIQYTLAVDRDADQLSTLYNPLHPAILRMIKMTCDHAARVPIPVALCGEMASEMEYTLLLLGLGLRELDMPASAIPSVKEIIRASTLAEARELAERALLCQTADEVEDVVFPYMAHRFPSFFEDID